MRGKLLRGETRASQLRTLMAPLPFHIPVLTPGRARAALPPAQAQGEAVWSVPVHGGRDVIVSCSLEVNPPCGGGVPACTPAAPLMCAN